MNKRYPVNLPESSFTVLAWPKNSSSLEQRLPSQRKHSPVYLPKTSNPKITYPLVACLPAPVSVFSRKPPTTLLLLVPGGCHHHQPPPWWAMLLATCPCSLFLAERGLPISKKWKKNHSLGWCPQRGLQICPSSVELTSVMNVNTRVKKKCE